MNCIDCEHLICFDKQCKYANENVKECIYFKNAHRKKAKIEGVIHIDMDYEKEVKEMLE